MTRPAAPRASAGFVLVSSLLMLLVVTILALSMFRSSGVQEGIAGNMREKQRALHAAESAQQYAEWWLSTGKNAASAPVNCNALLSANVGQGQICVARLATLVGSAASVPWLVGGVGVGVSYLPPNMPVSSVSAAGTYFDVPRFYIADLGTAPAGQGEVYQVDAVGFGGDASSVAVVESTFSVYVSSWSLE